MPLSEDLMPYRIHDEHAAHSGRGSSLPRMRPSQMSRFSDSTVPAITTVARVSPPRQPQRGGSLDRRRPPKPVDHETAAKTPVLCNKYVIEQNEDNRIQQNANRYNNPSSLEHSRRALSVPRQQQYLEPPGGSDDQDGVHRGSKRRPQSPMNHPSPSIMSPMGFHVHRQKYYDDPESDMEYFEEGYYNEGGRTRIKPVPIWLCVFLVVSYIFGGAFLFTAWEEWDYLDSAYFCFITLTTIGFGDFVPAKRVQMNAEVSIALCSLYLLFGISLLAMSFNLVQEEVISNVKSVAKTLGIIKSEEEDEEEED